MSKHTKERLRVVAKLYREYLNLPSTDEDIEWHHQTGKENNIADLNTIASIKEEAIKYNCIPLTKSEHKNVHNNQSIQNINGDVDMLEILFNEIEEKKEPFEFKDLKLPEIRKIYGR